MRASCSPPSDPHRAIVGRGHWWSRPTASGSLQANVAIANRQIWNDPVALREFLIHDENQLDASYVALVTSNVTLLTFV